MREYFLVLFLMPVIFFFGCGMQETVTTTTTTTSTTTTRPLPDWAGTQQFGNSADDYTYSAVVDSDDNVYLVGDTRAALDGNAHLGGRDFFLAKYDASGTKQWIKQYGTATDEVGIGAAVDAGGNIYITGFTQGGLSGNTNQGGDDIFIMKLNSAGVTQWTRQLGTALQEQGFSIAVDSSNVYVAGNTAGSLEGESNSGFVDAFLIKYDLNGNKQWTKLLGESSLEIGLGVAVDSSGNLYLAGYTDGALDGGTNAGGCDIYLAKYSSSGSKVWVRQLGTSGNDIPYRVGVDHNDNIYMAGFTDGGLGGNTNAGADDIFLVKYDSNGVKQWTRQLGTSVNDMADNLAFDSNNNIYLAGGTSGGLSGNTNIGEKDAFLIKYDAGGTLQWVKQFGTTVYDYSYGVGVESHDHLFVSGFTKGGMDGNTNAGSDTYDAFLMKFSPDGVKQ